MFFCRNYRLAKLIFKHFQTSLFLCVCMHGPRAAAFLYNKHVCYITLYIYAYYSMVNIYKYANEQGAGP